MLVVLLIKKVKKWKKDFHASTAGAMSCDKCNHAHPSFCVSKGLDQEIIDESLKEYKKKKNQKVMQASAETEFEYYCQATRVEETMLWAKNSVPKRLVLQAVWDF